MQTLYHAVHRKICCLQRQLLCIYSYVFPVNEGMNSALEMVSSTTVDAVATFAEADSELHT